MAATGQDFMLSEGMDLKEILTYAQMAKKRAKRTFGTIKNAIKKLKVENGRELAELIQQVLRLPSP